MRYGDISESGYAIKRVTVPIANLPHGIQQGTDEQSKQLAADGNPSAPVCGMRILSPGEDIEVDRLAELFAKANGVDKYDDVHPTCVKARMVYTLATACVDPDSSPHAPLLFFGDSIEGAARNLISDPKKVLTFDTIVYLHEVYSMWRDKVNPQANTVADYHLADVTFKAAESADFLAYMRPGMLLSYTHSLAVLCVNSPELISGLSAISKSAEENLLRLKLKPLAKTSAKKPSPRKPVRKTGKARRK